MRSKQRGRSHGFTLVELLVAVSIIALLVGVLLPSLKQAREHGRRAACGMHLRNLGTSWEVYTIEYRSPPQLARRGVDVHWRCADGTAFNCKRWERVDIPGFGPETFEAYESANNDGQVWLSACNFRNDLFQVSNPPPPGPLPGHWWNWGLLWLSGVVEDPRVFFCPGMAHPLLAWDTPLNPWPPSFETMWRPDWPTWVNHTSSSYERRIALSGVAWDRIPSQTTIAHDIGAPTVGKRPPGHPPAAEKVTDLAHRDGGNVVYRDGHVTYVRSRFFMTWWDLESDAWRQTDTHFKLLGYQYWLDTEGRWTPPGR